MEETKEIGEKKRVQNLKKVYILNYGNLILDIIEQSKFGIVAKSTKQEEILRIPFTSIIMIGTKKEKEKEGRKQNLQKVFILNYGNLILDIVNQNDIGIWAESTKQDELLFIPYTSIIMISERTDVSRD